MVPRIHNQSKLKPLKIIKITNFHFLNWCIQTRKYTSFIFAYPELGPLDKDSSPKISKKKKGKNKNQMLGHSLHMDKNMVVVLIQILFAASGRLSSLWSEATTNLN